MSRSGTPLLMVTYAANRTYFSSAILVTAVSLRSDCASSTTTVQLANVDDFLCDLGVSAVNSRPPLQHIALERSTRLWNECCISSEDMS